MRSDLTAGTQLCCDRCAINTTAAVWNRYAEKFHSCSLFWWVFYCSASEGLRVSQTGPPAHRPDRQPTDPQSDRSSSHVDPAWSRPTKEPQQDGAVILLDPAVVLLVVSFALSDGLFIIPTKRIHIWRDSYSILTVNAAARCFFCVRVDSCAQMSFTPFKLSRTTHLATRSGAQYYLERSSMDDSV